MVVSIVASTRAASSARVRATGITHRPSASSSPKRSSRCRKMVTSRFSTEPAAETPSLV
jgi:hypothetical protein